MYNLNKLALFLKYLSGPKAEVRRPSICICFSRALFTLLVFLTCICSASFAENYYAGQQYGFSTPSDPDYLYLWTATAGGYADTGNSTFLWTAPMVAVKTNVTISVLVTSKRAPSCKDEDSINITVQPLGRITVIKDAVPDDPQDFSFTTALGDFDLDDDSDPTLSNKKSFEDLLPGTYVINETVLYCWNLSDISCSGNASVEFGDGATFHSIYTAGDTSVKITLGAGNVSTCTFTNTKKAPEIKIVKTANTSGPVGPGDRIEYEIMVCNTGVVNVTDVLVYDDLLEGSPFAIPGSLVPGECKNVSDSLIYAVADEDLCRGVIINVAYATANDYCGNTIASKEATLTILTDFNHSIEISKTANVSVATVGKAIGYTIVVRNTGDVALQQLKLLDDLTGKFWNVSKLAPGESETLYTNYTVKPSDIGRLITNTVMATSYVTPCGEVDADESANATVETDYTADLTVSKTADYGPCPQNPAGPGANVTYKINVTNTGDINLTSVRITDPMFGLAGYLLTNLLEPGTSVERTFFHVVNESEICLPINNTVVANATVLFDGQGEAEHVSGADSWCIPTAYNASLEIAKTANRTDAAVGDVIGYEITVKNSGNVNITDLVIEDDLTQPGIWNLPLLAPGADTKVYATYTVTQGDVERGLVENTAKVNGLGPCGPIDPAIASKVVKISDRFVLEVNKTALQKSVKRGEEIEYLIQVRSNLKELHNVVVKDVFNKRVEFVSASPMPDADGIWRMPKVILKGDGSWETIITLKVKVPEAQDFEFGMDQGVAGEGFVRVANDYSTTFESYAIKNCIYVTAEETGNTVFSDCESVAVSNDPGTELSTREHGSGPYESAEQVRMRTENKSISMNKDMAATYAPTTIGLYNNRTVEYSSKWTEGANAKNRVTGATMSESYRYATSIDRESRMFLDKNQSVMEIDTEFDGMGHIGFLKMPTNSSTPHATPLFESREDYTGSFKVLEKVDEYGSSVFSEKAASGEGLVAVDKRVGDSQRSYESGTGAYDSEELIETYTNYIAKDINLVYAPMNQSLTGDVSIDGSLKWKEGMYSKTAGTSYIGEEYAGVTELDKETVARGLNEMETEAEFSGRARYRAVLRDEVDIDEQYEGDYSVQRRILFTGVPKYDRPHLNVTKTLDGIKEETIIGDKETTQVGESRDRVIKVATYTIRIENDGNRALGPIYVRDLFPPGSIFIEPSSVRPTELADTSANWTLTHLGIGDVAVITLKLDVTKYYPDELVNRVEVCGGYGDEQVCAYNFSALEKEWLTCCLDETVSVTKAAKLDAENPNVVWYRIDVHNPGDVTRAATVTDSLPAGMTLLDSMVPFASYENDTIVWNLIEIGPRETVTIAYRVEAQMAGRFVNSVEVDARSVDGPVVQPVRANSVIDVGEVEECGASSCSGWQPPNWDFEYVGYTAELSCEGFEAGERCGLAP